MSRLCLPQSSNARASTNTTRIVLVFILHFLTVLTKPAKSAESHVRGMGILGWNCKLDMLKIEELDPTRCLLVIVTPETRIASIEPNSGCTGTGSPVLRKNFILHISICINAGFPVLFPRCSRKFLWSWSCHLRQIPVSACRCGRVVKDQFGTSFQEVRRPKGLNCVPRLG